MYTCEPKESKRENTHSTKKMKKFKHQNLGCILCQSKGEYCHICLPNEGCLPSLISPLKI